MIRNAQCMLHVEVAKYYFIRLNVLSDMWMQTHNMVEKGKIKVHWIRQKRIKEREGEWK